MYLLLKIVSFTHVCEYLCIIQPYGCHSRFPLNRPSDSNHLHESVPFERRSQEI